MYADRMVRKNKKAAKHVKPNPTQLNAALGVQGVEYFKTLRKELAAQRGKRVTNVDIIWASLLCWWRSQKADREKALSDVMSGNGLAAVKLAESEGCPQNPEALRKDKIALSTRRGEPPAAHLSAE
jgi:hypothetical protein